MIRERSYVSGVSCDATDCDAHVSGEELPGFEGDRHYVKLAVQLGWTVWAGRSARHYCPVHGPAKGHRMHLVKGTPRTNDEGDAR